MLNGGFFGLASGLVSVTALGVTFGQSRVEYFPPEAEQASIICSNWGRTRRTVAVDEFQAGWFGRHLSVAEEPSLYLASRLPEPERPHILRFDWLRSFDPAITVRVTFDSQGGATLVAKELSGAGGYSSTEISRRVERVLTGLELDGLHESLSEQPFDGPAATCDFGLDGAQWVLEEVSGGGYRVTNQWSPEGGAVRGVGLYLLGLTGWDVDPVY
jgi:hypothetical protein